MAQIARNVDVALSKTRFGLFTCRAWFELRVQATCSQIAAGRPGTQSKKHSSSAAPGEASDLAPLDIAPTDLVLRAHGLGDTAHARASTYDDQN
jgi:hypothetical protein